MKKIAIAQSGFFFLAPIAGSFAGMSSIINLAYTPLALLFGAYLFRKSSPSYLYFTIWLWMLTPLVRRLVDYHTSYHAQSSVMLAPFVVSCISIVSLRRLSSKNVPSYTLPYLGILCIVLWGFIVGILESGLYAAAYAALTWLSPLLLALHILFRSNLIEENSSEIFKAFEVGALVMGAYGIYQFFVFPPWDNYWVANSQMGAIGFAEAGSVRIFSTLNSPGVFALFLASGIIAAFVRRGALKSLIFAVGITALMLSLVRSAWACFLIAFIIIITSLPWKQRIRYIGMGAILAAISVPFFLVGPISDRIQTRLQTLNDLKGDASFQARTDLYEGFTRNVYSTFAGSGLGSTGTATKLSESNNIESLDSGILDLTFTFGVISFFFFLCLFLICLYSSRWRASSMYGRASGAITLALTLQLLIANILYAPTGILIFVFSAIAVADSRVVRLRPARAVFYNADLTHARKN